MPKRQDLLSTPPAPAGQPPPAVRRGHVLSNKVPQITLLFWIIKILTTGMGETASDWLLNRGEGLPGLGPVGAIVIDTGLFVVALVLQFSARRYTPVVYWFAVVAVSVFGTVAADVVHFVIGVPLWATTLLYAGVLALNFGLWYRAEGTLSFHSIVTRRRETFYWIAVFSSFALGTALGDLTGLAWQLGFLPSGILFTVLILIPAVAHFRFGVGEVLTFWSAYVVTRPLGASFADWFAANEGGGLGLGTGRVTLVATVIIVVLVAAVALRERSVVQRPGG